MVSSLSLKKYSSVGVFISVLSIIGLLGPWVTLNYDSYAILNPVTKLGEKHYRSRIELSPFYATVTTENVLETRLWYVSEGTAISGAIILLVSFLNVLKLKRKMLYLTFFVFHILGLFTFFLSLGRGVSIGLVTQPGWGLSLTLGCTCLLFGNAFYQMTSGVVSRS